MNFLWITTYSIVSIIHLYACFFKKFKVRFYTKPFLMPILMIFHYSTSNQPSTILLISLFWSFMGDVFFIFDSTYWGGVISFFIADVIYSYISITNCTLYNFGLISSLALIYYTFYTYVPYKSLSDSFGNLKIIGYIFGIPHMINSLISVNNIIMQYSFSHLFIFLGTFIYPISDYILIRGFYKKKMKHGTFYVMLTYIVAQFCIIYGLSK